MGFRYRKSFGSGPFRINISKSGVGYSVGTKGLRYTKKAGGGIRTTASIPGTGISYVKELSTKKERSAPVMNSDQTAPTSSNPPSTRYCKYCYRMLDPDAAFCPACGKSVAAEDGKESFEGISKKRKPFYLRWWFWVIISLILLRGCGALSGSTAEPAPSKEIQTAIGLIEIMLEDEFEHYEVSYEDNTITVNLWEDGLAVLSTMANAGDEACIETWNELTDVMKDYSLNVSELVNSLEIDDTSVLVFLLNDQNTDNVLITASYGIIINSSVATTLTTETEPAPTEASDPWYLRPEFNTGNISSGSGKHEYILNTDTKKFHYASCGHIDDMDSSHKSTYTGEREDLLERGYEPCGHCDP